MAMSSLRLMAYNAFIRYAKAALLDVLKRGVHNGCLIIFQGKEKHLFGNNTKGNFAEINVKEDIFWARIYLWNDLGFAEAFMDGNFDTPNLKAILELWIDNRHFMEGLTSLNYRTFSTISALSIRYFGQTPSQSSLNAATGYDCSNDFFKILLGEDMSYSSALWPDSLGGVRGDLEDPKNVPVNALHDAQMYKIKHILHNARVCSGDRLLEFGSGWGSMAIEAAKLGCTVDTITLSIEQKKLAEKRIAAEGLQDKIRVHLLDYRNLPPEFEHAFDAFVSVEMVEAVGLRYLPQYFKIIDWALKIDKGTAIITSTTRPEARYTIHQVTDYSRRYQWPNSFLPSATSFVSTAEAATKGRLSLESAIDYGHHYPRTLRDWGRRLQSNWNPEITSALINLYPDLARDNQLETFKRKWEYMCIYAEVGFARAYTSMHYFSFVRPDYIRYRCD